MNYPKIQSASDLVKVLPGLIHQGTLKWPGDVLP